MMRVFAVLLLLVSISMSNAVADDKSDVAEMAKKATTTIVGLLKDKSLDDDTCKAKVQKELDKIFDFPLTAKLTLGRKYWPVFTPEQQKEFQKLFIKQLVDGYFKKAKLFADEEIQYGEAVMVRNKIHMDISFISKGEKILLKNKFYKSKSGWKIYDMEIQDISIVRSYGSQYAEVLRGGTAADLLKKMRGKKLVDSTKAQ